MKRVGYLYDKLLDIDYIKQIIIKASKGKKRRREVRRVLNDLDYYANETLKMIKEQNYTLRPTHNKTIVERGKTRVLTISPFFPNRILDYLMVETMKPIIRKGMYEYCVGNVDGRGISCGVNYIKKNVRRCKYFLKLDIHHFYPSVNSERLYECLCRHIKDKRFLKFCKALITHNRDLPIGSYYSQWFSNLYLQELDHYVKELGVPYYVRYVDDMVLMGNSKKTLLCVEYKIQRFLVRAGLCLKRFEPVKELDDMPIDFLGYRFYQDKTNLRLSLFKRINRRIRAYKRHCTLKIARSLLAYLGWLKKTTYGYLYIAEKISKGCLIQFVR